MRLCDGAAMGVSRYNGVRGQAHGGAATASSGQKQEGKQRRGVSCFSETLTLMRCWALVALLMCLQKHRRGRHTPHTPSAGHYGLNLDARLGQHCLRGSALRSDRETHEYRRFISVHRVGDAWPRTSSLHEERKPAAHPFLGPEATRSWSVNCSSRCKDRRRQLITVMMHFRGASVSSVPSKQPVLTEPARMKRHFRPLFVPRLR